MAVTTLILAYKQVGGSILKWEMCQLTLHVTVWPRCVNTYVQVYVSLQQHVHH